MGRKRRKKEVKPLMAWRKSVENGEVRIESGIGEDVGRKRAREPEKVKTVTGRGMGQVRGAAKSSLLAAMPGEKRKLALARQKEKVFAEVMKIVKRGMAEAILRSLQRQIPGAMMGTSGKYRAARKKFYRGKSEGERKAGRITNSDPVPPPPHK